MKLYSSLSRTKEDFKPLNEGKVGMYVCGPTVYDVGHLGHARSAVAFDVIRRYFLYKGFEVEFVSNVTDVDDKIIARAAKEGITESELVERIIPEYAKDYGALGVLPPTKQPRCTQYIPQMVALVEHLVKTGHAYPTDDGVYFRVASLKSYGELSGQNIDELQSGARIEVDEKKENPLDFAVWKAQKPGEQTASWDGPCGIKGRPGWHIECSAMSGSIFGDVFDIHGGGIDLIFPHHEDEVAQSMAAISDERLGQLSAEGRRGFAQVWMHNGHVRINKEKMSKSLGNFFTIKDMLSKWHPAVLRYFLISTHYRLPIEFSDALLEQAKNSLERLRDCVRNLDEYAKKAAENGDAESFGVALKTAEEDFSQAMDDDFEISKALAAIFELVTVVNSGVKANSLSGESCAQAQILFKKLDSVLGVLYETNSTVDADIDALIVKRNEARKNRDFATSDAIRKELDEKGIVLEDTPAGTVWKKKL